MSGRPLCTEEEAARRGFADARCARRRQILRETIAAFERAQPADRFQRLAAENLARWQKHCSSQPGDMRIEVFRGDWGEVTRHLTKLYGECFAVLNMANAYVPGGAYVEGAVAQEENMFRRTDCHFHVGGDQYDEEADRYLPWMTKRLSAEDGTAYLDTERPRVCIRGPEDRSRDDLGYPWLRDTEVFPFFELRAAAQDLRGGEAFDGESAHKRIAAQLDALRAHGIRYAVLGASGCGAFRNPADRVARIYKDELLARACDFSMIGFAILGSEYGPDNFTPFASILAGVTSA